MHQKNSKLRNLSNCIVNYQQNLTQFNEYLNNQIKFNDKLKSKCSYLLADEIKNIRKVFSIFENGWKIQMPAILREFMDIFNKVNELYQKKLSNLEQQNEALTKNYQVLLKYMEQNNLCQTRRIRSVGKKLPLNSQPRESLKIPCTTPKKKIRQILQERNSSKSRRSLQNNTCRASFNKMKSLSFDPLNARAMKKSKPSKSYNINEQCQFQDHFESKDATMCRQQQITELFAEQQTIQKQYHQCLQSYRSKTMNDIQNQADSKENNILGQSIKASLQQNTNKSHQNSEKIVKDPIKKSRTTLKEYNKKNYKFEQLGKNLYKNK